MSTNPGNQKPKGGGHCLLEEEDCIPEEVFKQNRMACFFKDYFTLYHYRKKGWNGYVWFAIGEWEPNICKHVAGRKKIEKRFRGQGLKEIRKARKCIKKGEPNLFLYKPNGDTMFLLVRIRNRTVSCPQYECLAQIRKFLKVDVGIVRLWPKNSSSKTASK